MNKNSSNPTGINTRSKTTSEPLHLASQHGHISVTSYLLQNGFHADSGAVHDITVKPNTATPLHRACYSGAIGCIQLLLDHDASLLARDNSFFDEMTPLHKAVKGGRFLAVAVIVNFCKKKNNDAGEFDFNLLRQILMAKDASDRTPLELARELESLGEEEILSMRRWDSVAGGTASFSKCIDILNKAIEEVSRDSYILVDNMDAHDTSSTRSTFADMAALCDCEDEEDDNGNCKTAAWEKAFTSAILKSTASLIGTGINTDGTDLIEAKDHSSSPTIPSRKFESLQALVPVGTDDTGASIGSENCPSIPKQRVGQPCGHCGQDSLALFRAPQGILVCRQCLRRSRSKR